MQSTTKLYIVEKNESIINRLTELFFHNQDLGISVIGRSVNHEEALEDLKTAKEAHVFLISIGCFDEEGSKLITHLSKANPKAKFILTVDASTRNLAKDWLEKGAHAVLQKPFKIKELVDDIELLTKDTKEKAEKTLDKKEEFIRWLLKTQQFLHHSSVWVYNYILANDVLEHIHFVEGANHTPRGIQFGLKGNGVNPIRYFENGNVVDGNPETIFHRLRLHVKDEHFYVEVLFDKLPIELIDVLEENPYQPACEKQIREELKEEIDKWLEESLQQNQKHLLQKQIDEALDRKDKELFMALTELLKIS